MRFFQVAVFGLVLALAASPAFAKCGRDIAYKTLDELPAFSGTPATGDLIAVCDTSDNRVETMDFSAPTFNSLTVNGDIIGDGTDQLYGFLQDQVASTTVSATIAQCGKTFVNDSADVITLPEASTALGCRYTFVCGNASNFDINPADGTDQIGLVFSITGSNTTTAITPSAGDAIRCAAIGASIQLEAVGANLWVSVGNANGTWTDVN